MCASASPPPASRRRRSATTPGTAIDFQLVGHSPPGNTGHQIPLFIAVLLPFFNGAGWFSGIGFNDTMHFEVSDDLIRKWAADGKFKLA